MNVLLIASLVLREASRRRLLLTALLVTVALVALTGWGFNALAHATNHGRPIPHYALMVTASALTILMAFMFSVVLSLGAAFLGALSIGTEIENGTLLAIVPRPIRRSEIAIGKWLGNLILIGGYAAVIAGAEFLVVYWMTGYMPPQPIVAIAYLIVQSALVLTLTMCLSVRLSAIASGFATIVLFGIGWIGGIAGTVATALHNVPVHQASLLLSLIVPTDGVWRGAVFALEPAAMVATIASSQQSNPFVTGAPPALAYLIWCSLWFVAVAVAGIRQFCKRDI